MLLLAYGKTPKPFDENSAFVVSLPPTPTPPPLETLLTKAMTHSQNSPSFFEIVQKKKKITLVINDNSRKPPSKLLATFLRKHLEAHLVKILIATGTHAQIPPKELRKNLSQLFGVLPATWSFLQHDADANDLVFLGHTKQGTEVRLSPHIVNAEQLILLGHIKPHYFAGYAGGLKSIFPGCAGRVGILQNHLFKAHPTARIGNFRHNTCREDMEEAAKFAPSAFLINEIGSPYGNIAGIVAGEPVFAHRQGCELADSSFRVFAKKAQIVIVSGSLPVSASLYQAAKLIATAAPLLLPGGTLILAAECLEGIGPLERVNEGIYRLGLLPLLPESHEIILVSSLSEQRVTKSFAKPAPSVEIALAIAKKRLGKHASVVVIPDASELILSPQ